SATVTYPKDQTVITLFEEQVIRTPEAIAVIFEETEFTYQEVSNYSNQLAHYLQITQQLEKGSFVGIKLKRDAWLLISILAVLKNGAAYVPIDINYPEARIAFIESDSNCELLIDCELIKNFKYSQTDFDTEFEFPEINTEQLSHIIYTSGSTGQPKGVQIAHGNVMSLLNWSVSEFGKTPFEIVYAATSHCFDLSVFEMFYPLITGKKLRILPDALTISSYLSLDHHVLLNTVPSVIKMLIEEKVSWENIVAINMAGEALPVSLANYFSGSTIEIRNLYGPSEDTTYTSYYKLINTQSIATSVPIGRPIPGTQIYVLDKHFSLCPTGVIGELCIAGNGLSKGYLNREDLTASRFIPNPFSKEKDARLYRTGDLAYWRADGNLMFTGRADNQ
ncbi:amino acid adenylation domain-containing protein, partial [Ascidiimonas sp. W6]|uniref:amino acid adenylation domain-containing protein n=1 Tax=Ascidiimonas meishanensis TaxID=3128903 RepID=UPI0030EBE6EA